MTRFLSFLLAAATLCGCARAEFRFIHMSDPQIGFLDTTADFRLTDSLFRIAAERANGIGPECVIITGDLINVPGDALQDSIYRAGRGCILAPVYEVPGNHDIMGFTPAGHDAYVALRGSDRFSFCLHGCAFIGIDSNCIKDGADEAEAAQLEWLTAELRKARLCRYRFLFLHCPIFLESADEPEQYFNFPPDKRRRYLELLKEYRVDAVFAGHTHMDYRAEWEGIRFYTAGPVGMSLGRGYSGFNVVTVGKDSLDVNYFGT